MVTFHQLHGLSFWLFFSNPCKVSLHVEVAAVIDWGEPFVKATYELEGDGPLAIRCYEIVDRVRASVQAANTPNC